MDWVFALTLALLLGWLLAHDTWVLATLVGDGVKAVASTSDGFPTFDNGVRASRAASCEVVSAAGRVGAATFRPHSHSTDIAWTGTVEPPCLVALRLHPHPIALDRVAFEAYLACEGRLEQYADRVGTDNREVYTKCAKGVPRGVPLSAVTEFRAGHPLEIVPSGEGFAVLKDGKETEPGQCPVRRFSADGAHLVRAQWIEPVEAPDHGWVSVWATLTYYDP